eukprot:3988139-Lingulodinium_polyedra.AAC.1
MMRSNRPCAAWVVLGWCLGAARARLWCCFVNACALLGNCFGCCLGAAWMPPQRLANRTPRTLHAHTTKSGVRT